MTWGGALRWLNDRVKDLLAPWPDSDLDQSIAIFLDYDVAALFAFFVGMSLPPKLLELAFEDASILQDEEVALISRRGAYPHLVTKAINFVNLWMRSFWVLNIIRHLIFRVPNKGP